MSAARVVAALVAAGALLAPPAGAQFAPGARATAMAGAGLVFASGLDAVELNPANLGRDAGWHVSIMELGGSGLLSGTTFGDFMDVVEAGGEGDPALVARIPADGFTIETSSEGFVVASVAGAFDKPRPGSPYPTLGVAVGPFALRVRSQLLTTGTISREVTDLLVTGFEEERLQEYAVGNTAFRIASWSEITLAYGRQLGRVGFGLAARRVQGHKLTQIRFFEPEIDLDQETLQLDGVAVESPGGSGVGLDLGMTFDLGPGVRWSLAIENAFQRMSWDRSLRVHEATFTDADFDPDHPDYDDFDPDTLIGRFQESELDPGSVSLPVFQASQGLFEEAFFPTIVRAGAGWRGGRGTRVELAATAVAPRGRQRSAWDQRLSLGLEQRLPVVTLRAGYAHGQDGLRAIAGGVDLGLGPVHLEAGIGSISGTGEGDLTYDGVHGSVALSVRAGGGS